MHKIKLFLIGMLTALNIHAATPGHTLFEKIFTDWTYAFNHKALNKTCALFSNNVKADYQGIPKKDYSAICDGFKKIFDQKEMNYQYHFKLHSLYAENNLAVIRITWYLDVSKKGKPYSHTQDEGMDIFQRNETGEWKIVNYIAYPIQKD